MASRPPARFPWRLQSSPTCPSPTAIISNNHNKHHPSDIVTTALRSADVEHDDPTVLSTIDLVAVIDDPFQLDDAIDQRYDYLRAQLIAAETKSTLNPLERALAAGLVHTLPSLPPTSTYGSDDWPLGIAVPKSVAVLGGGRRSDTGYRSMSLPTLPETAMAHVRMERVGGNHEDSAPSSPPELSYSKSSKSSSSLNSDDELCASDSGLSKDGLFEEVALEDTENALVEDSNLPPASRPTLRRPPPKSFTGGDISGRRSGTSPQLRPLPNGLRQKYPSLQGAVSGVLSDQSLNLPHGRSMQRAASSPTSPYMRQLAQRTSSRSPSPIKPLGQNGYSSSPQTLASSTPKQSFETLNTIPRRPSWQPGRKTVKELEAEYNDEDEDVPDEAILENVPISPLPGHYSTFKSPTMGSPGTGLRSTTPSPRRSPRRPSHAPLHANLHSANIPKGAKRPSAPPSNRQYPSPRSPINGRPHMIPHSATVSAFPPDMLSRKHRSKSWTEHLNVEARELSQKLEEYAGSLTVEKRRSLTSGTKSAAGSPPPPPSVAKPPTRSKTSITEIPTVPPVQKGNIMIDPLPISKEKEAVLSRTRPSWLPPKSQKEERKHLKEFQQMMARAAEAEKKRALKEQESRENKEEMQGSIARIWDQHVLPNWDAIVKEPRTRELWWRGVTPRSRGEVWQKAIGNELELTATSFEAALKRAKQAEEKVKDLPAEERPRSKEAAWMDAIKRDVPNTLPETKMYQAGAPLHQSLTDVLKAYAMYRSDVGYVYGCHLIAGILCLLLPSAEAFILLANMLNRPLPLAFLIHDQAAMAKTYDLTLQTLKYKFPKLHDHLTSPQLDLPREEFLDPMFRALFAYNLPHESASRIWDVFAFEGDKALVRAAVAILGRLEGKLYGGKDEILELIGWRNEGRWDVGTEDELMNAVREAGKVDAKSS